MATQAAKAHLFFGEVADNVVAAVVDLAEDVEQENRAVVLERLVVQEQLGDVAEILRTQKIQRVRRYGQPAANEAAERERERRESMTASHDASTS